MFNFNRLARSAVAALGALMLTSVAVGAAVGPATGSVHAVHAAASGTANA